MQIERTAKPKTIIQPHIMLPSEHGAWIFLFGPLAIGLALGGRLAAASGLLVVAALAAFLLRQPVTIITKVLSGRRPRSELRAAIFWLAVYGLVGLLSVTGISLLGFPYILLVAIPAVPVMGWHLWLVSRRAERHQMAVELAGSAVLALAAPAAYWVGKGLYDPAGWLIWGLSWLQTAGSIIYAYLRLRQRRLSAVPTSRESLRMGAPALAFNSALLVLVVLLGILSLTPAWLPAAFAVQWMEVLWGIWRPAVHVKPAAIGKRQLAVSILSTLAFILSWV